MATNLFVQEDHDTATPSPDNEANKKQYLKLIRQRIKVAYALLAVGTALAFIQNHLLPYAFGFSPMRNLEWSQLMQPLCVLSCLIMFWLTRVRQIPPEMLQRIGLLYQAVPTFFLGFSFFYRDIPEGTSHADITYVAIWIIVFPLILPAKPWKTLASGLFSAAMPVVIYGLWLHQTGGEWARAELLYNTFSPNFFCAIMSAVPAYLVYHISLKLIDAQRSMEKLGSYKLVKKLGAGGMGEVWQAEHMTLARPAAIKLIKARKDQDEGSRNRAIRRFKREAKATAGLNSPHTVNLFDYGINEDGTFYYVMELLHGMDLETLVKDYGPIPPNRALYFLEQICDSLAEAHAAGLVHRDIKPSNLYLCHLGLRHDFVKVFDFGLVSETKSDEQAKEDVKLTAEGNIIGTPAFLAPEMARAERIDPRADIYSLGCVAFWLLTGEYVFPATSPFQMVISHMSMPADPPSKRAQQAVPPELDQLVLDCLGKFPKDRPKDAEELQRRLKGILLDPWTEEQAAQWWDDHPKAKEIVEVSQRVTAKYRRILQQTSSEG